MKNDQKNAKTDDSTKTNNEGPAGIDLDALLRRQGAGSEVFSILPEEKRPAVLRAYIRGAVRALDEERASRLWKDRRKGKTLLSEREEHLIDALELASEEGLDALVLQAAPTLDSFLREKLDLWGRMAEPYGKVPSLASVKERWLTPYFDTLSRLRTFGYTLSEQEASQSLLDGLEAAMDDEASALTTTYQKGMDIMYFDHRRIERAADLVGFLEERGATGGKEALLSCLYGLFTYPREHHTFSLDYDPSAREDGMVVLVSEEKALSTLEERFSLLNRLERSGYTIDIQRVADAYMSGLHAVAFSSEKKVPAMSACGQAILSRLAWLEKRGADLTELYRKLSEESVSALDGGADAKAYLPLLGFLAGRDAFDADQLAFIEAITYK